MNFGTAITLLIVAVVVFFALRSIMRDMHGGGSTCAECGGSCGKADCSTCDIADKLASSMQ